MSATTPKQPRQAHQYARGETPYPAVLEDQLVEVALAPVAYAGIAPEVGGIQREGQRAFEHLGDLMGVGVYFDRRRDHADDRRHQEPGHGGMVLDLAEDAHPLRRDAGLLLQLAQACRPRILITSLDAPAGEADLPGVIGKTESLTDESFEGGLLEYPHYTRPENWRGQGVPELLLSGHHERIRSWRREAAERITRERRPDLWARYQERTTVVKD